MKSNLTFRKEVRNYLIGGMLCLGITLFVFFAVTGRWWQGEILAAVALLAALLQFLVQSKYFLHLSGDEKPHWRTKSYLFTIFMLLIIVVGSLWIMMNLNYNMGMSPEKMTEFMHAQNKKGF
jgi:cytochrome o ubiquinol oxidase operon protein cyoD